MDTLFSVVSVATYTSRSFSATNKKTIRRKVNEIDRLESKAAENNGLVDQSVAGGRKWDKWAVVSGQRTVGNVASLGVDSYRILFYKEISSILLGR